jgi:hypothetical protein
LPSLDNVRGVEFSCSSFQQCDNAVAKAQGEPQIEPDCPLDDFSREPVAFVANFPHPLGYLTEGEAASSNRCDNAKKSRFRSRHPRRPRNKLTVKTGYFAGWAAMAACVQA